MCGFFSRYSEERAYPPNAGRAKYRKLLILSCKRCLGEALEVAGVVTSQSSQAINQI